MKLLRIVLYIAALGSFYSLTHAVANIRYCIQNVGSTPLAFYLTSLRNDTLHSSGVKIVQKKGATNSDGSKADVQILQETLIYTANQNQPIGIQALAQIPPASFAFTSAQGITSLLFTPFTDAELKSTAQGPQNYVIACNIDVQDQSKTKCSKTKVLHDLQDKGSNYNATICQNALTALP